ncbi:GGDEF domain-containing protein [Marinomonas alcarazii]|nr:GGDEF domain-containing protein [Marinomonas alcarazii]
MKNQNVQNDIKISTIYRMLIAFCLSSFLFLVFFAVFPRGHIIDVLVPGFNVASMLILLAYLHQNPLKHANLVIKLCAFVGLFSLVPATYYFLIMAWLGKWRFIDEFPPITGVMISAVAIGMIMLPKAYKNTVALVWLIISLPILHYLVLHPNELHSQRGYEILSLLGPASLLLCSILPYQRRILRHLDSVASLLRRTEEEAGRDFLTDLYNRRGLQNWMGQLNQDDKICVLLIDIDYFKNINDRYGHGTGDHVLVEVASRLRSIYFEKHIITRWGGEEFAIVLVNPKTSTLPYIGTMFQNSLGALPYKTVGKVTVSVGVSNIAAHEHFFALVEQADKALYSAKNNGRDQSVIYNDSLSQQRSPVS